MVIGGGIDIWDAIRDNKSNKIILGHLLLDCGEEQGS